MKTNNMDFMNNLARDCFNYIISDENFLPNVKKVFGIESTVVSEFGSDNKEYIFCRIWMRNHSYKI